MRARPARRPACTALAAGLAAALCAGCAEGPGAPNVLLVSVDTLRRDALRAFDAEAPENPALDALARESVRFENAWSPSSWTLPAHASLLTGLYPERTGATDARVRVAEEAPRLAARLRAAGYETAAFTEGGYVDRGYGFGRGFQRYDAWSASGDDAVEGALPRSGRRTELSGERPFDRALAFLEERAPEDPPFFLFAHTYGVHDYFRVHPRAVARAGPPPEDAEESAGRYLSCLLGRRPCSEASWERLRALYAAEVAHLDAGLARLLEVLAERGLAEHTVVLVLSDHGEGFAPEAERIHHGGRLDPDLLRVPLLARVPGVEAQSVSAPVSLVDVTPTLLRLAGTDVPEGLDGRSLAGLLGREGAADPPDASRPLYALEHQYWWEEGRRRSASRLYARPLAVAVLRGAQLLVRAAAPGEGPAAETLWRMDGVPDGARVVPPSERTSREEGWGGLHELAGARAKEPRTTSGPASLDRALEERLRALGYAED